MISTVERRKDSRGGTRVAKYRIEIDHSVIPLAQANPRVDPLALDLVGGRKDREWRSRDNEPLIGGQCGAIDLEALRMRALDELLMALDNLIDGDLLSGTKSTGPPHADVVAPQLHDHMGHSRLGQHVPIEPGQSIRAHRVMKNPAAGNSFVEYSHSMISGLIYDAVGELVWPSFVCVLGRIGAIRDRVPKGHNRLGLFGSPHLYVGQPVPRRKPGRSRVNRHDGVCREIS